MTENERLKILQSELGFSSQAKFAEKLHLKQGSLSDIYRGKGGIKVSDSIKRILEKEYSINIDWLEKGEGEMQKPPQCPESPSKIRYWVDVDATAGGVQQFDDMVTDKYISLSIPEFRDCTDAVNLYGDSMVPLYKSGQIIILKEWRESFIDFGNVYLVVTKSGNRMVKYLRKGSDPAHILCVSENKEFDPFEIEKTDILRLYLVKGGISKNTL